MKNNLSIKFKIVTPERIVYESEIYQATLPVADGLATILPNHRSYIASLKSGEIVIRKEKNSKEEISLVVSGGFIEFNQNSLVVLADAADRAEEIDLMGAEEAVKRAEELKKQKISVDDAEYARVAATLEKEMAWMKVARKYAQKRGFTK